jgi:hypothetical protein
MQAIFKAATVGALIRAAWWLWLAYLPFQLQRITGALLREIGCGPVDCYVPGTTAALYLDFLTIQAGAFIWPVCFWFLIGRHLWPKKRAP